LGDLPAEDHVHHHLESSRGVGKSKEHNRGFEEAFWGEECCLPFVAFLDADIVISPSYVELSKEGAAGEAVDGLRNEWGYIAILLRPLIDWSVVLDRTEFPVFFLDEEEVCSVGAP